MAEPRYRWVIVAAGAVMGCIAVGAMFSLPVLLRGIVAGTGWSTTGVSAAMTVGFLAMAVGSAAWGTLSDRIGARWTCLIGALLLGVGLALAARAQSLTGFQLAFGLLVGLAASAIFAPTVACVTGWFSTQRSLAVSMVSAGFGVAPLTMSPWVAWLAASHDWRQVLQIVAILVVVVIVPVSFLVRRPPALERVAAPTGDAAATPTGGTATTRARGMTAAPMGDAAATPTGGMAATPTRGTTAARAGGTGVTDMRGRTATDMRGAAEPVMPIGQLIRSPAFIVLVVTNFFCCATHSGPIIHTVSYAVTCGIPLVTAVSIYSVEGLAGLGGRIAFGLAGDRFGARRTLIAGLSMQALFAAAYYFAGSLNVFYAVAALFGFTYGGVMPLYAVLARENFPLRMMGTVIGGTAMAGSLGMATGPVLGGWLYDTFGSYASLYLVASGFGIVAVMMAMTFKPRERSPDFAVTA
jgi:MFS family permease